MPSTVDTFAFTAAPAATAPPASAPAPGDGEQQQSFSDVLHEHGGDDSNSTPSASGTGAVPSVAQGPAVTASPASTAAASPCPTNAASATTTIQAAGKDLMKAQGTVVVTSGPAMQQPILPKTPPAASTTTGPATKAKTPTLPAGSDLSAMMVQASILAATFTGSPTPVTVSPAFKTALATGPEQLPTVTAAPSPAVQMNSSTSVGTAVSVVLASGTNVLTSGTGKLTSTPPNKEKKSDAIGAGGKILQGFGDASSDTGTPLATTSWQAIAVAQTPASKSVTPIADPRQTAKDALAALTGNAAGTANDEKAKTMNSDATISALMTGTASQAPAQLASADTTILLSSNSDFENALQQVMHIAQLSESASSAAPTRVAIELQTPPGAIVNVYVTKQDDQYRAQLSTSDAQALSWVQDKLSSLKSTDLGGVEVKWLPPQLEGSTTAMATSSGSESNLNWNRDGQNQQHGSRHHDESPARNRNTTTDEDLVTANDTNFFGTFAAIGGVS